MKTIFVIILVFLLYGTGNTWASCEKEAALLKNAEVKFEGCQNVGAHNSTPDRVAACNERGETLRVADNAWKTCNYIATQPKVDSEPKFITACRQFINNWDETTANVRHAYGDCRKKGESHETCYVNLCKVLQKAGGEKTKCMRANGAPGPGVSTQCQVFLPGPQVFPLPR